MSTADEMEFLEGSVDGDLEEESMDKIMSDIEGFIEDSPKKAQPSISQEVEDEINNSKAATSQIKAIEASNEINASKVAAEKSQPVVLLKMLTPETIDELKLNSSKGKGKSQKGLKGDNKEDTLSDLTVSDQNENEPTEAVESSDILSVMGSDAGNIVEKNPKQSKLGKGTTSEQGSDNKKPENSTNEKQSKTISSNQDVMRFELQLSPISVKDLSDVPFHKFMNSASDCALDFSSNEGTITLYFVDEESMQTAFKKLCQLQILNDKKKLSGSVVYHQLKYNKSRRIGKQWTPMQCGKMKFDLYPSELKKLQQLILKELKPEDENKKSAIIHRIPLKVSRQMLSPLFPFSLDIKVPDGKGSNNLLKGTIGPVEVVFENEAWMTAVLGFIRNFSYFTATAVTKSFQLLFTNFKIPPKESQGTSGEKGDKRSQSRDHSRDKSSGHDDRKSKERNEDRRGSDDRHGSDDRRGSQKDRSDQRKRSGEVDRFQSERSSKIGRFDQQGLTRSMQIDKLNELSQLSPADKIRQIAVMRGLNPNNPEVIRVIEMHLQLESLQTMAHQQAMEANTLGIGTHQMMAIEAQRRELLARQQEARRQNDFGVNMQDISRLNEARQREEMMLRESANNEARQREEMMLRESAKNRQDEQRQLNSFQRPDQHQGNFQNANSLEMTPLQHKFFNTDTRNQRNEKLQQHGSLRGDGLLDTPTPLQPKIFNPDRGNQQQKRSSLGDGLLPVPPSNLDRSGTKNPPKSTGVLGDGLLPIPPASASGDKNKASVFKIPASKGSRWESNAASDNRGDQNRKSRKSRWEPRGGDADDDVIFTGESHNMDVDPARNDQPLVFGRRQPSRSIEEAVKADMEKSKMSKPLFKQPTNPAPKKFFHADKEAVMLPLEFGRNAEKVKATLPASGGARGKNENEFDRRRNRGPVSADTNNDRRYQDAREDSKDSRRRQRLSELNDQWGKDYKRPRLDVGPGNSSYQEETQKYSNADRGNQQNRNSQQRGSSLEYGLLETPLSQKFLDTERGGHQHNQRSQRSSFGDGLLDNPLQQKFGIADRGNQRNQKSQNRSSLGDGLLDTPVQQRFSNTDRVSQKNQKSQQYGGLLGDGLLPLPGSGFDRKNDKNHRNRGENNTFKQKDGVKERGRRFEEKTYDSMYGDPQQDSNDQGNFFDRQQGSLYGQREQRQKASSQITGFNRGKELYNYSDHEDAGYGDINTGLFSAKNVTSQQSKRAGVWQEETNKPGKSGVQRGRFDLESGSNRNQGREYVRSDNTKDEKVQGVKGYFGRNGSTQQGKNESGRNNYQNVYREDDFEHEGMAYFGTDSQRGLQAADTRMGSSSEKDKRTPFGKSTIGYSDKDRKGFSGKAQGFVRDVKEKVSSDTRGGRGMYSQQSEGSFTYSSSRKGEQNKSDKGEQNKSDYGFGEFYKNQYSANYGHDDQYNKDYEYSYNDGISDSHNYREQNQEQRSTASFGRGNTGLSGRGKVATNAGGRGGILKTPDVPQYNEGLRGNSAKGKGVFNTGGKGGLLKTPDEHQYTEGLGGISTKGKGAFDTGGKGGLLKTPGAHQYNEGFGGQSGRGSGATKTGGKGGFMQVKDSKQYNESMGGRGGKGAFNTGGKVTQNSQQSAEGGYDTSSYGYYDNYDYQYPETDQSNDWGQTGQVDTQSYYNQGNNAQQQIFNPQQQNYNQQQSSGTQQNYNQYQQNYNYNQNQYQNYNQQQGYM